MSKQGAGTQVRWCWDWVRVALSLTPSGNC
jgi:hypothetical protein